MCAAQGDLVSFYLLARVTTHSLPALYQAAHFHGPLSRVNHHGGNLERHAYEVDGGSTTRASHGLQTPVSHHRKLVELLSLVCAVSHAITTTAFVTASCRRRRRRWHYSRVRRPHVVHVLPLHAVSRLCRRRLIRHTRHVAQRLVAAPTLRVRHASIT